MDERVQGTHCPRCGQQNGVIAFYLGDLPCYKCPDCHGWGRWDNPDGTISYRRAVSASPSQEQT